MKAMRARISLAFVACAIVTAFLSACSDDPGQPGGNRAPETGLVFVGDLDTTLYVQEVKWWGSDSDGDVVGFEYRWVPRGALDGFDTSWVFTTDASDTFALPTPEGFSEYDFYVRSIDDRGERDATPATQRHPFQNAAPSCSLSNTGSLPDTLFPSFELQWVAGDPDGAGTLSHFLVWIDGGEANPIVVEDGGARSVGFAPRDFASAGPHTIFLQAVDTGLRGCEPDSVSVVLLPAPGQVLLVDDMTRNDSRGGSLGFGYPRFADYFYATNLDTFYRQERQEDYSTIDLERFPIGSSEQARRLLDGYRTIVWYDQISINDGPSTSLAFMEDVLPEWIQEGGQMVLVSMLAINYNVININPNTGQGDTIPEALFGERDDRFRRTVAGIEEIITTQQGLPSTYSLEGATVSGVDLDDLRLPSGFLAPVSLDIFAVRPEVVKLYTIPAGTFVSQDSVLAVEGTVGSLREYGEGRFVLLGFPFSRMGKNTNDPEDPVPDDTRFFPEFRKILSLLENGP